MELQNREGNFNRMFADQQPVHVDPNPDHYLVNIEAVVFVCLQCLLEISVTCGYEKSFRKC